MTEPYYTDDTVTLYHGDCREIADWLQADVLVTDPPYGIAWERGRLGARRQRANASRHGRYEGIDGDEDTAVRDTALAAWGARRAVAFGSLSLAPPAGTRQVLIYRKPPDAGVRAATAGFRRDVEGIYLIGPWPSGTGGRSSILTTATAAIGSPSGPAGRYGHPHAKPVDVMLDLLERCPPGTIADPFAGAGSTLVAAKQLGRRAIGIEVDERYCEMAARRLSQGVLPIGGVS